MRGQAPPLQTCSVYECCGVHFRVAWTTKAAVLASMCCWRPDFGLEDLGLQRLAPCSGPWVPNMAHTIRAPGCGFLSAVFRTITSHCVSVAYRICAAFGVPQCDRQTRTHWGVRANLV